MLEIELELRVVFAKRGNVRVKVGKVNGSLNDCTVTSVTDERGGELKGRLIDVELD